MLGVPKRNKTHVLKGSKLSTALNYALNHQEIFMYVLLDGRLELSNNKAERAVKSLVMGHNYVFKNINAKIGCFPKALAGPDLQE